MRTISLLLLLLSLTFCQKESMDFDIALALPSDPPSLDPLFATDLVSQKIAKLAFAGLYEIKNSRAIPNLVEKDVFLSTKVSHTLEFTLKKREGLNLDDVVFSLSRLKNVSSPRQGDYNGILAIKKNIEKGTIRLTIASSLSEIEIKEKLSLPFASIISEGIFKERNIFSSFGPYQITEWKKNEHLFLKRRSKEDSKLPKTILIRILPQSTTSLFLYKKAKIDAFKLSDFLLTLLEADKEHTIVKKGRSVQYVAINNQNPCFDKNFRYALNYSIPRDLIITKLLEGKADMTIGPIPIPFYKSVYQKEKTSKYSYNLTLAKKYLTLSACYPKIADTILDFRMRGDDENQAKGRAITQALIDLGLKVRLKGMEKAQLYKENGEGKGDLTLLTWYADYASIWNFLDPTFHGNKKGNGGNRALYENKKITVALEGKNDLSLARKVIDEIEEDAPWIFLWSIQENFLVSDKFILFEGLSDYL